MKRETREKLAAAMRLKAEHARCRKCGRKWAMVKVPAAWPPLRVCRWGCNERDA